MNAVLKGVKNNISSTLKQRKYFYKPHCSAGSVIFSWPRTSLESKVE